MVTMSRRVLYFRITGKSPFKKLNYKNQMVDNHQPTQMIKINHDFFLTSKAIKKLIEF